MDTIEEALFAMRDEEYRRFQSGLMPTVDKGRIIGVRTPALRAFAKTLPEEEAASFLQSLPHRYYEENNLHAYLIERIRDFDRCLREIDRFLPYVDNWATCDSMSPKALRKEPGKLAAKAAEWLSSDRTYTIRFGIGVFMGYFADGLFDEKYARMVAAVRSEEYYVRMMQAWYFATLLAKHWEETLPFITEGRLDVWTHNKAISKACDSYRITPEQKELLKKYRKLS